MKRFYCYVNEAGMGIILFVFAMGLFISCGESKPNLVTNGSFDSNTSGWAGSYCKIAIIPGGQSGNCLEITMTEYTSQWAVQPNIPLTVGKNYRFSAYVKSGTSGNEPFSMTIESGPKLLASGAGTSSGSWVQYSGTFKAIEPKCGIYLYKHSRTPGTMLFDTVILQEE